MTFLQFFCTAYGIVTFLSLVVVGLGILKAISKVSHKNISWISVTISVIAIILLVFIPILNVETLIVALCNFEEYATAVEFALREDRAFTPFSL
jgi:hypothetical protein